MKQWSSRRIHTSHTLLNMMKYHRQHCQVHTAIKQRGKTWDWFMTTQHNIVYECTSICITSSDKHKRYAILSGRRERPSHTLSVTAGHSHRSVQTHRTCDTDLMVLWFKTFKMDWNIKRPLISSLQIIQFNECKGYKN